MKQHKWHKEIKHLADGGEIEYRTKLEVTSNVPETIMVFALTKVTVLTESKIKLIV